MLVVPDQEWSFGRTLASARLEAVRGRTPGGEVAKGPHHRKSRIAVVEDQEDLLSFFSTYLKQLGYDSVYAAMSGEDLVRAVGVGKASPEMLILDYRLPGIDGIETAKRVLALKPGTKVVITTADDSVKKVADSLGFGFLLKPFSLSALVRVIEGHRG